MKGWRKGGDLREKNKKQKTSYSGACFQYDTATLKTNATRYNKSPQQPSLHNKNPPPPTTRTHDNPPSLDFRQIGHLLAAPHHLKKRPNPKLQQRLLRCHRQVALPLVQPAPRQGQLVPLTQLHAQGVPCSGRGLLRHRAGAGPGCGGRGGGSAWGGARGGGKVQDGARLAKALDEGGEARGGGCVRRGGQGGQVWVVCVFCAGGQVWVVCVFCAGGQVWVVCVFCAVYGNVANVGFCKKFTTVC